MEENSIRKLYLFCFIAAAAAIFLLAAAMVRDHQREWKAYQTTYREILLKKTDPRTNPEFYGFVKAMRPKVRQVMVDEFNAVDRCVSCHVGIDDAAFSDADLPLRTHSNPALLKQHPVEKYGCTICHSGQGLATTHEGAGHKPLEHWHDAMLGPELLQARCGYCHGDYLKSGAPKLAEGEQLFRDLHCLGCHKMGDEGGRIGTELTYFADKGADMFDYTYISGNETKPNWIIEHFRNPYQVTPGTQMRRYGLSRYDMDALTTFLLSRTKQTFSAEYQPQAPAICGLVSDSEEENKL